MDGMGLGSKLSRDSVLHFHPLPINLSVWNAGNLPLLIKSKVPGSLPHHPGIECRLQLWFSPADSHVI